MGMCSFLISVVYQRIAKLEMFVFSTEGHKIGYEKKGPNCYKQCQKPIWDILVSLAWLNFPISLRYKIRVEEA